VRGEVVGGAAGRGGDQHAVADQLVEAVLAIEVDAQVRGLARLSQQRDLVVGERTDAGAGLRLREHLQWLEHRGLRGSDARDQRIGRLFGAVMVHQETDAAQLHAIDRLAEAAVAVQRLQHEAVAAERAQHVGVFG